MSRSLSKSQEAVTIGTTSADFVPAQKGQAVLVEFSDFQCPACRMYYPFVKKLGEEMGDKLVIRYKYFPLKSIHKNAEISARAGESAKLQGKFNEMEDVLFTKQDEWAFSDNALTFFQGYAKNLGLDMKRFNSDIEASSVYSSVNADYQEGVSLNVSGTPTFFLNGKKINNPRSYEEFKSIIEQALAN